MEFHWIKKEGNRTVTIFVLGWSADHNVVGHILPQGSDVLCVYDYRDEVLEGSGSYTERLAQAGERLRNTLSGYSRRQLAAWSFGVWVARKMFRGYGFDRAVAFNGTPLPADEKYGIGTRRLAVTVRGLSSGGMEAFNRRVYGQYYDLLQPMLSPRTQEANVRELKDLIAGAVDEPVRTYRSDLAGGIMGADTNHDIVEGEGSGACHYDGSLCGSDCSSGIVGGPAIDCTQSSHVYASNHPDDAPFEWHGAVIGSGDVIFEPENMLRYWGGCAKVLPLPHYPFGDAEFVKNELGKR